MCRLSGELPHRRKFGGIAAGTERRRSEMLLSEILGVDLDTDFGVEGVYGKFQVRNNGTFETLVVRDGKGEYDTLVHSRVLLNIIAASPSGIIHLPPPLTDEQREQLKAIWTLGYSHLAKDKCGSVYAYEIKPYKKVLDTWLLESGDLHFCCTKPTKCLESIVSWSDSEPFDIGKALGVGE